MKTKTLGLSLVLSLSLLGACSNNSNEIEDYTNGDFLNAQSVLDNYELTKTSGAETEELIFRGILSNDVSLEDISFLLDDVEKLESLHHDIQLLHDNYIDFIDTENQRIKSQEEDGIETIVHEPLIEDQEEYLRNSMTTYYFLNNATGVTEQMFLLELPNGLTKRLSLYWIGGLAFDYEMVGN